MKYLVLLIIFLGTIMIFSSCHHESDLTKDEVYKILNEIITDDSLKIDRICSKYDDFPPFLGNWTSEFTESDRKFIQRQKIIFKDFRFESKRLKWYWPGLKKFVNVKVDTICDKDMLYRLSFPLISANRQKVLIEITRDCNCMLGGQGGKYLYIKQNGHWKRIKSYDSWISRNIIKSTCRQHAIYKIGV